MVLLLGCCLIFGGPAPVQSQTRDGHTPGSLAPDEVLPSNPAELAAKPDSGRDYRTFSRVRRFGSRVYDCKCFAFSPDGRTIAYGGAKGRILIREVSSRCVVAAIDELPDSVDCLRYSPDGKLLVAAVGKRVKMWNTSTYEHLRDLPACKNDVSGFVFSPDGRLLAVSVDYHDRVDIWDMGTVKKYKSLAVESDAPGGLQFSTDGKTLLIGDEQGRLTYWDVEAGLPRHIAEGTDGVIREKDPVILAHSDSITSVAVSPDGRLIATAGFDKVIKLWSMATGEEVLTILGNTEWVNGVAFSPDGKTLLSCCFGGTTRIWDVATGRHLAGYGAGQYATTSDVGFSPLGDCFASAEDDHLVLWGNAPGKQRRKWTAHAERLSAIAFNSTGTELVTAGWDKLLRTWDVSSGTLRRSHEIGPWTQSIAVIDGDKKAAVAGRSVDARDLNSGAKAWDSQIRFSSVALGPDGGELIAFGDQSAMILHATSGERLRNHDLVAEGDFFAAISPDGKRFAVKRSNGSVSILGTGDFAALKDLPAGERFQHAAFSPEGLRLAGVVTGEYFPSKLTGWDIESGTLQFSVDVADHVSDVRYSPDGRFVLITSHMAVIIHDATGGDVVGSIEGHADTITCMAYSRDGSHIATGDASGEIRLWQLSDFIK
ncbi:MAG: WD40 repeat domain-containing protein [Planctomycetes bacterium]|nr:WD40 repeat domain-containing protein [Planctomycetota bacterium]